MNLKQKRKLWNQYLGSSRLGSEILESEAQHLEAFLQNFVGYNFLQISPLDSDQLFFAPRIKNTYFLVDEYSSNLNSNCLIGKASELPFIDEAMDLVFLHHFLEWQESPHSVLKEAVRVLHPKGYLLLATFRPISLWRFHSLYRKTVDLKLKHSRIEDWLEFLDMEIVNHKNIFTRFLTSKKSVANFSKKLDKKLEKNGLNFLGSISLIWAQKKIGYPKVELKSKKTQIWNKAIGFSKQETDAGSLYEQGLDTRD